MKNLIIFFCFFLNCSCKGQNRIDPIKDFEVELTDSALEKFKNNCPYDISNVFLAGSSFFASFEAIGNSGVKLMFNLNKEDLKLLESRLKKYNRINNKELKVQDYKVLYPYNNKLLLFNDVSDEWKDLLGEVNLKNEEVEIYLIEEGKLENTFIQEGTSNKPHNFVCGIYLFKKMNKLIYWFAISK